MPQKSAALWYLKNEPIKKAAKEAPNSKHLPSPRKAGLRAGRPIPYKLKIPSFSDQNGAPHPRPLPAGERGRSEGGIQLEEDVNMKKKVIHTEMAPKAIGPYSQAIQAGDFLFLSGQLPLEPASGEMVKGDIRQQTQRVLENIKGVLESQNLGLKDVVKVTVFLKDMGNFSQMNEVYATYFPASPPARSTVEISGLARGAGIEIEAIAMA